MRHALARFRFMSVAQPDPSPPSENQYQKGANDYRTTVKWVLSTFGTVAAALVGGLQVTSLGALHGWRLYWALVAALIALGAVLIIVIAATSALLPVIGTYAGFAHDPEFKALRDFLRQDSSPLQGEATSAAELAHEYELADAEQQAAWTSFQANEDDAHADAYERAQGKYESLDGVVQTVTSLGLFLQIRNRVKRVMRVVYVGVLATGIGAIAFAYLAHPPAEAQAKEHKDVSQVNPVNCARYYSTLDELTDDERSISKHWPAPTVDAQANACGLHSKAALAHFLSYLALK